MKYDGGGGRGGAKTTNKQTKNKGKAKSLNMGGMQQASNSNIHSDIHVKNDSQTNSRCR